MSDRGARLLGDLVAVRARLSPTNLAVSAAGRTQSYGELDRLATRIAREFAKAGVGVGDRVGIFMEKSCRAVAAMQAALRLGAIYVPIDATGPVERAKKIVASCQPKVVVASPDSESATTLGVPLLSWNAVAQASAEPLPRPNIGPGAIAYILYTSGSTGEPKGVAITHDNALACIDWAVGAVRPTARDRFSNHAPFHFDLSVLDLYVPFSVGASVHLVPEDIAYLPTELVAFVVGESITVWYSVPSALMMMMDHADFEPAELRVVLFAGEPFPLPHLRKLRTAVPKARLMNLYGPTETNVCTFHEVTDIPEDRESPMPIGRACSGDRVWAQAKGGGVVPVGGEGELMVEGATVMYGYWGAPPHVGPYSTGDIVRRVSDDSFEYVGRCDDMVKVRGHRVELGEIEAALSSHEEIRECAVVVAGTGIRAKLVAFLSSRGEKRPSILALKQHCAKRLPRYMIVDKAVGLDELPRTRNGKVDRAQLKRLV